MRNEFKHPVAACECVYRRHLLPVHAQMHIYIARISNKIRANEAKKEKNNIRNHK